MGYPDSSERTWTHVVGTCLRDRERHDDSGGAIYTARNFQIAHLMYRLNWAGFKQGDHAFPVAFNVQGARKGLG